MRITWRDKISNNKVLTRAKKPAASTLVKKAQLRRTCHVVRMEDGRLPKHRLCGQLTVGNRHIDRPKLRSNDVLNRNLKRLSICPDSWEAGHVAQDRKAWRTPISTGTKAVEDQLRAETEARHLKRHNKQAAASTAGCSCTAVGRSINQGLA